MVFINDYKLHDVCFFELCNVRLHEHYNKEGLHIEHNVEFNDAFAGELPLLFAEIVEGSLWSWDIAEEEL